MKLVCPECKNDLNLLSHPDLKIDDIIECEFCGITLKVVGLEGEQAEVEIVDEGK